MALGSLPDRQLRKAREIIECVDDGSLPDRQLRKSITMVPSTTMRSLPDRQLRKFAPASCSPPCRSLPDRQLRNEVKAVLNKAVRSLPDRQLRKIRLSSLRSHSGSLPDRQLRKSGARWQRCAWGSLRSGIQMVATGSQSPVRQSCSRWRRASRRDVGAGGSRKSGAGDLTWIRTRPGDTATLETSGCAFLRGGREPDRGLACPPPLDIPVAGSPARRVSVVCVKLCKRVDQVID